jgi:3-hydroxybutyryl-CoA dehydrogenase
MGRGIAQLAAAAGHRVVLGDVVPGIVERAREAMRVALARDVAKERIDQAAATATLTRVEDAGDLTLGFAAYARCGIVIEAIV